MFPNFKVTYWMVDKRLPSKLYLYFTSKFQFGPCSNAYRSSGTCTYTTDAQYRCLGSDPLFWATHGAPDRRLQINGYSQQHAATRVDRRALILYVVMYVTRPESL